MSDKLGEDEKKEYRAILDENMSEATLFLELKKICQNFWRNTMKQK